MSNYTVIDRVKDGMREAARLYGWVDNVYGTIDHIDFQVKQGLDGNLFPFPVFYAIRFENTPKFKVHRVFLEKDLTEGTRSEYIKAVTDPDNYRSMKHVDSIRDVMNTF